MTYFVIVCIHNDEIVYSHLILDNKAAATQCYGMLPFLTAQMAWMMVALRPPLPQVRLLLLWVAVVYFVTGKIFEISTWDNKTVTLFEFTCMVAAVLTFVASAARGEMLARNHFMIEFLAKQARE